MARGLHVARMPRWLQQFVQSFIAHLRHKLTPSLGAGQEDVRCGDEFAVSTESAPRPLPGPPALGGGAGVEDEGRIPKVLRRGVCLPSCTDI